MISELYNQYLWLIDTIRSAGQISKSDIDKSWAKCGLNVGQEKTYPLRTFHRHREQIFDLFGIYIGCDRSTSKYYISSDNVHSDAGVRARLCNTLALSTVLMDTTNLRKRVYFEDAVDGSSFLPVILSAMRDKHVVQLVYKAEKNMTPVVVIPYCLKERRRQWFLAAKPLKKENVEVQVFCLEDVEKVYVLRDRGSMPKWFKGNLFFDAYFEIADTPKKKAKADKHTENKLEKPAKPIKKEKKKTESAKEVMVVEQLSLF